jgi:hypothetical protein
VVEEGRAITMLEKRVVKEWNILRPRKEVPSVRETVTVETSYYLLPSAPPDISQPAKIAFISDIIRDFHY